MTEASGGGDGPAQYSLAEQAGISLKALRKAREHLCVVATRQGNGARMRSIWSLPTACARQPPARDLENARSGPEADAIRAPLVDDLETRHVRAAGRKLLRNAHFSENTAAVTELISVVELTLAEQARVARRLEQFVVRGMNATRGRNLAIRLVVERDRTGAKSGSCIECSCWRESSCSPGDEGHTSGPRAPAEIWMCWCARRK